MPLTNWRMKMELMIDPLAEQDLAGKIVVIKKKSMLPAYQDLAHRIERSGCLIFGEYEIDTGD